MLDLALLHLARRNCSGACAILDLDAEQLTLSTFINILDHLIDDPELLQEFLSHERPPAGTN